LWHDGSRPINGRDLLTGWSQPSVMQIQKRSLGWLPKPSLYNEMAAKRAKQKANHQAFLSSQSNLASTIGSIMTSNTQGTTEIVSNIALARIGYNKKA
jgi:hypothetical protein